jgi:hypothetical protein
MKPANLSKKRQIFEKKMRRRAGRSPFARKKRPFPCAEMAPQEKNDLRNEEIWLRRKKTTFGTWKYGPAKKRRPSERGNMTPQEKDDLRNEEMWLRRKKTAFGTRKYDPAGKRRPSAQENACF